MNLPPNVERREHVVIDLSDVTPHTSADDRGFFDSAQYSKGKDFDISGTLSSRNTGSSFSDRKLMQGNYVATFLSNHGFDWLLDVEEDGIDYSKSLFEELDIDLTDIFYKVRCVLLPLPYFRYKINIVRDSPDFWGPLIVVSAYALLSLYGQLGVLSWILIIWLVGSFFVFFLARALGGEVGYGQVLGIVGYCLIPLVVIGLLISLLSSFPSISIALGCFGILWSVYSAGTLLCVDELREKKSLLLYPVFLLYVYFFSLYSGV
ncbi:unnamed protein product [Thelazia callipaeda]|uniref:Protein YIPF n=1 Tax=Thelazia callipaeda TaxID=103827 RepID=A0A0N5CQF9_THECL|nr:unnamed protein product [Thelazia callipaeda]